MSDENVPKLRLKPKLAGETSVASEPAAPGPTPTPAEPVAEASKLVRLKPKLSPAPAEQVVAPAAEPEVAESTSVESPGRLKPHLSNPPMEKPASTPPMPFVAPPPAAPEVPAAAAEPAKPAFKLGLKPKATEPATMPGPSLPAPVEADAPLPPELAPPPTLSAPPPMVDRAESGEPAEITAMRRATGAPFPPPGKFPPPPGLKKAMGEAGAEAGAAPKVKKAKPGKPGARKKLIIMAGGGVLLLALLGGGFVTYQKLTEPPPEPPRRPRPAAKPATPPPETVAAPDPAAAPAATPAAATPVETKPAAVAATPEPAVVAPVEPPKPVVPPPPPPPSASFRAWVENLQVRGVRGGATPRIFIGSSSYQKGDLVNPSLGITFDGYNDATRVLSFKDKTGARVERRH